MSAFKCPQRMVPGDPAPDTWFNREGKRCCSYCGSLHPADVLARLAAGDPAIPTDKSYKVYIGQDHDKFYFQHFSDADQAEFVRLYNLPQGEGRMRVGDPGHFYRLPYFMRLKEGN